jgi:propionyl-CoA carboxylase alpha chain
LVQDRYRSGNITTKYLQEEYPEGFKGIQLTNEQQSHLIACSALVEFLSERREYLVTPSALRKFTESKYLITMQVIERKPFNLVIQFMGTEFNMNIKTTLENALHKFMPYYPPPDHSKLLIAPMPGSIVSVAVKAGDQVKAGQELVVMEAMKMQNVLKARDNFKIKKVNVKPGDVVNNEQVMIEFE